MNRYHRAASSKYPTPCCEACHATCRATGYDGFGNLSSKTLNGALQSIPVNPQTNRLTNAVYDANGNMTSGAGASLAYNMDNRMVSAMGVSGGMEIYWYAPDGKRMGRSLSDGTQLFMLNGIYGEELGTFTNDAQTGYASTRALSMNVYFAGGLIFQVALNGGVVLADRLGTNRASGARFRPYGDEITSTANDREKFGTYSRDSYTGLDISPTRAYASTYGRFNLADPYQASGGPI